MTASNPHLESPKGPVNFQPMDPRNCSAPAEAVRRERGRIRAGMDALLCMALAALLPACGLLRAPQTVVNAVVPAGKSSGADPVETQAMIERFADDFSIRAGQALDDYAELVGTTAAKVEATRLKLLSVSAVTSIASGPNPASSLLDMVCVVTLARRSVEDYWMKTTNGAAFQPWLEQSRMLDTNVWELATNLLKPSQVDELREAIDRWYARNPSMRATFFTRPQEYAGLIRSSQPEQKAGGSVFDLVNLDPTAGLDPAVREVAKTRLFAERALYTAQRLPYLIRWQTELLTYQLTGQAEVQQMITNTTRLSDSADRISHSVESVSQTAAQLPDRITAERKAILDALDQQEGKLRDLAAEVNRSLVSADKMSASLSITITNFDALMKRFGVGEPSTNSGPPDTNSPPFNILDYGKTADHIGGMAKDLNVLLTTVNQSVPQLAQVSQQAGADAQKVVDHAFRLGLVLIGVLLAGSLLAALFYRALANRLARSQRQSSTPN